MPTTDDVVTIPVPVREQFARQAPYYPGTFWEVDGHVFSIDDAGHPVRVGDAYRPQLCWIGCTHAHTIRRLRLIRDDREDG